MNSNGISFFIKTYKNDFDVLPYCIRSINNFFSGLDKQIIVCCDNELEAQEIRFMFPSESLDIVLSLVNKRQIGYIDQQIDKLSSYIHCMYDDIFIVDSDAIFFRQFNADDFKINNKNIIPYCDWGWYRENKLPPRELFSKITKHEGRYIFSIHEFRDILVRMSENVRLSFGVGRMNYSKEYRVVIGEYNSVPFWWSCIRNDLMWTLSGHVFSQTPVDTMRYHYMVNKNLLRSLTNFLEQKYQKSLNNILYDIDLFPAPSEYQMIGNFALNNIDNKELFLTHELVHDHLVWENSSMRNKFPYIKYNAKDRDLSVISVLDRVLNGEFVRFHDRYKVLDVIRDGFSDSRKSSWC